MPDESVQELIDAAKQLAKSGRGQDTLKRLLDWLEDSGLGLDGANQTAVYTLLRGAWGRHPMTARDAIREALE